MSLIVTHTEISPRNFEKNTWSVVVHGEIDATSLDEAKLYSSILEQLGKKHIGFTDAYAALVLLLLAPEDDMIYGIAHTLCQPYADISADQFKEIRKELARKYLKEAPDGNLCKERNFQ